MMHIFLTGHRTVSQCWRQEGRGGNQCETRKHQTEKQTKEERTPAQVKG